MEEFEGVRSSHLDQSLDIQVAEEYISSHFPDENHASGSTQSEAKVTLSELINSVASGDSKNFMELSADGNLSGMDYLTNLDDPLLSTVQLSTTENDFKPDNYSCSMDLVKQESCAEDKLFQNHDIIQPRRKRKGVLKRLIKKCKTTYPPNIMDEVKKDDMLKYPSDVDSDEEISKVQSLWDNAELDSSDAESIDFEQHSPLQHATVLTEEELILTIRNKLIQLQNLYIKEFRKIIYTTKEKQKEFALQIKKERETYGPLSKPSNMSYKEREKYEKLKALSEYHKHGTGPETLLFKKMIERKKAATPEIHSRSRIFNKCVFTEGGMRCSVKVVPGSKYCLKHILKDTHQVLFSACGVQKSDLTCEEPVIIMSENRACVLHSQAPRHEKEEEHLFD